MRFFRARRQTVVIDPTEYIEPLPPQPTLTRRADGLHVCWPDVVQQAQLFAGALPGGVDWTQPVMTVRRAQQALLPGWQTAVRPVVGLRFEGGAQDGQQLVVAERLLDMPNVINFRDFGGHLTENGRQVRWGRIYRAGMLADLTEQGQRRMDELGIRRVCDLRSNGEMARRPDNLAWADDVAYWPLPIESFDRWASLRVLRILLFQRSALPQMVRQGYVTVMLQQNTAVIAAALRLMANSAPPLVVHCTAGKDRTGIVMSLLLRLLGVPEEVVVADYSLSNHFYDQIRTSMMPDVARMTRFGVTIDDLWPLLIVDPASLRFALDYIRQAHGTVEAYLREAAGLDAATIAELRESLLY